MLMVIFGAGASYDSSAIHLPGDDRPYRPPLANDLFEDRGDFRPARGAFREFHGLIPQLIPLGGRSIEQTLQRYSDQASGDPVRKQQLTAIRYYLSTVFESLVPHWLTQCGNFTNYDALLEQIRYHRRGSSEPVCLVTFNYDSLLEQALSGRFGMHFETVDDYIIGDGYQVYKLHGSHTWGRYMESVPTGPFRGNRDPRGHASEVIAHIDRIRVSTNYTTYAAAVENFSGPPLFPAIAIPVETKTDSTFECPPRHLAQLQGLVPRITKILAVGWRGHEQHFLNILRAIPHPVSAAAVAESVAAAQQTLDRLQQACPYGLISPTEQFAGFSTVVRDESLNAFLAA